MDRMRDHSPTIVEQALLVSQELIRVAILWHELWHEGLEEASRLYYTEKNPEGMIAILEPLHELLEAVCPLYFFICIISYDFVGRAQRLHERHLLHRCSDVTFEMQEKHADVTGATGMLLNSTRLGTYTTEYAVSMISVFVDSTLTLLHRSSERLRNRCHSLRL